ncbi:MAG: hypothetical protein HKN76_13895, partial [Saprospiraceae bacterium]|nr:hypothetical protein [Saprospiraceae bacterium]
HLPGDVPVDVHVGEATTDEMMLFFMSLSFYQEGDEDMIIDTTSHKHHHNDCILGDFTLPVKDQLSHFQFDILPNPASSYIIVRVPQETVPSLSSFSMIDPFGKTVLQHSMRSIISRFAIPETIPSGVYYGQVASSTGRSIWQKIVIFK